MSDAIDWLSLLDQAKSSGVSLDRSPIPAGRYGFKVVKAEATVSKNNNTNYKVTAEVQNGPHARRYVFENITLSEKAAVYFFRKMAAMGADEGFFRTQPTPQQVAEKITGAFFEGEVEIEPAQGNYDPKNRISKWFPVRAGGSGGPSVGAYSTPAVQPAQVAPAPAPAVQPAQAAMPAPAPAPAPQQANPAADPWATTPSNAAPAPAPAAPWETSGGTPF